MSDYQSRWRQSLRFLETNLLQREQDVTTEGLQEMALTIVTSMVRTGAVPDFVTIQRYQHERGALFELLARHLTEVAPMLGAACLDVVTGQPREYGLDVVIRPRELPPEDRRARGLADHEQNLVRLGEVGVWHSGPHHPTR